MSTVRVVIERHSDGDWELRTSDVAEFSETLGEDVLAAFCTCFVHADRVVSLIGFLYLARKHFKLGGIAERRNFLTFAVFIIGTLKELAENLKILKTALYRRGLLDKASWDATLGRWQKWGTSGAMATARKKLAFHVDSPLVAKGIRALVEIGGRRTIIHGATGKTRDSAFVLAQDAALAGLERSLGGLNILGDPADYLDVASRLETEFIRVLRAVGLDPIKVRASGRRAGS